MPTGYTSQVMEGKITSVVEYGLLCARNFGACVMLRDEPLSSDIPEFTVDDRYYENVEKSRIELETFNALTETELTVRYAQYLSNLMEDKERRDARNKEIKERYEAMLEKVRKFKPPTPDHENYAEFLVSQLEQSIEWDCVELTYDPPVSIEEWINKTREQLEWSHDYDKRNLKDEINRVASRNQWISELKKALSQLAKETENGGDEV